jgi:hypothetical protein
MRLIYIALILPLAACDAERPKPQVTEVYGYYIAGLDSVVVSVDRVSEEKGAVGVEDTEVQIVVGNTDLRVPHQSNGDYFLKAPSDWAVMGESVTLEILGDIGCTATSLVPPSVMPTLIGNTTFTVNPSNPGAAVFDVKWDPIDGFSYLLSLQSITENAAEIPFSVPSGLFQNQFFAPIEENEVTLFDTDFKYYGRHRLTIYVIEDLYKDFFFFRNRGQGFLATQGPDNIRGARGLWTCINAYQIELEILN